MTLYDDPFLVLSRGDSALALLEAALRADALLRLRSQAADELRRNPGSASWQDALSALDVALAQMAAVRASAGLDGVGRLPSTRERPTVIDLTDDTSRRAASSLPG